MTDIDIRRAFFDNRPAINDGHVYDYVIKIRFSKSAAHAGLWSLCGWRGIPEHIKKHVKLLNRYVTLLDEMSDTQQCELNCSPETVAPYDNTPSGLTDAAVNTAWGNLFTGRAAHIKQAFYNHLPVMYNGMRYEYISAFEVIKDFGGNPRHEWNGAVKFAVSLAGLNSAPIPIEGVEVIYKQEERAI